MKRSDPQYFHNYYLEHKEELKKKARERYQPLNKPRLTPEEYAARRRARFNKPKYQKLLDRSKCSRCGFIPTDKCQIDSDHIDGNHRNNDPQNLQALCANCHRLKTWRPELFQS